MLLAHYMHCDQRKEGLMRQVSVQVNQVAIVLGKKDAEKAADALHALITSIGGGKSLEKLSSELDWATGRTRPRRD